MACFACFAGKGSPKRPALFFFHHLWICFLYGGSDFRGDLGLPGLVEPLSLGRPPPEISGRLGLLCLLSPPLSSEKVEFKEKLLFCSDWVWFYINRVIYLQFSVSLEIGLVKFKWQW